MLVNALDALMLVILFDKALSGAVIEFVGNEEASDGVTYWAYETPNVTVSITSNCSANETHWFSVSNNTQTFHNSVLSIDEDCQSCVCTTINSTTSVSTECAAENGEFIFRATMSGLSSETTNFTVEFRNSTSGFSRSSSFRSCLLSELRPNLTVVTNTSQEIFNYLEGVHVTCSSCTNENSTIRVVCDFNGEWNDTTVNCDDICESSAYSAPSAVIPEVGNTTNDDTVDSGMGTDSSLASTQQQSDSASGQTTTPTVVQSQSAGQNSSEANGLITAASPLLNDEDTLDGAVETQSSQLTTSTPSGTQNDENDASTSPSSSLNTKISHDDVTTSSINTTEGTNATSTSSNYIDAQTTQIIAVCVATNVIMVISCCVMIAFFRHKRSDERKSRSHQRKSRSPSQDSQERSSAPDCGLFGPTTH